MVLLKAGDQVPAIPLFDIKGKVKGLPAQISGKVENVGVDTGFITIVIWFILAQGCATGSGVKVYNIVMVLLMSGVHMPVIPFGDVSGNENGVPEQNGPICMKLGVRIGLTITSIVTGAPQGCSKGSGVKV